MSIFAIILTAFLEQKRLLNNIRNKFNKYLQSYIEFFTNRPIYTQREIRYIYLFACLPIIVVLGVIGFLLSYNLFLYFIFKLMLFIVSVNILTWKEQAKTSTDSYSYINTFAINFFATLFWFLIIPTAIGSICYLVIIAISNNFKEKGLDSVIYNVTVDKMLFYTNVIPYTLLCIFIALAGNFEEATHFIVAQRKSFIKSNLYLDNVLREVILIAIGKEKFQKTQEIYNLDDTTEGNLLQTEKFNPQINSYITAILYRAGLFFIGLIAIISIANTL
jgi:hypothetical protein